MEHKQGKGREGKEGKVGDVTHFIIVVIRKEAGQKTLSAVLIS
jgi:hypothetical protein